MPTSREGLAYDTLKGKAILDLEAGTSLADDAILERHLDPTLQLARAQVAMDGTSPPTATAGKGFVVGTGNEGLVAQLASPVLAVRVQTGGFAFNSLGARIVLPTTTSLAVDTAHATNPRKDIVVLTAAGALAVRKGTAAGSPSDPTLTVGDVPLARILLPALQTTVSTADLTDLRERKSLDGSKILAGTVAAAALVGGAGIAAIVAAGLGNSANYAKTTSGAQTLLAQHASKDRAVLVIVQVTETFADAGGTQPTFTIGETSTATKFAGTSAFAGKAAGTTLLFGGLNLATKDILVTGVAAVGAGTGAITVTVLALPTT